MTHSRRQGSSRERMPSAGFAWLFSYFPPSPSHSLPTHPLHTQLFLRRFWRKVLDHLAIPLDSRRIVYFLSEDNGRLRNADDFTVEDLVAYADEVTLVVGCIHHRDETAL